VSEAGGDRLPLGTRLKFLALRSVTTVLKLTGQRERVLAVRLARARRARRAADRDSPLVHPALHDMDRKLDALLDRDGGFFVEAGGNNGFTQSNTYWLERFRGWKGILVEPMQELYEAARDERPDAEVVRAALVPFGHEGDTVRMRFAGLMSTVSGQHADDRRTRMGTVTGWSDPYEADVPARTLSDVLDAAGAPEIDLLSLDVEGYEPSVLAGLDLSRHAPRWILAEVHDLETGRPPIEAVLGDRYVFHGTLSPLDVLYRRADVPAPPVP
jgi:FkbM family methyltransferase